MTKDKGKLGVIGYPIAHSLSPVMHNGYLQKHNLNYTYEALEVAPQDLESALKTLKEANYAGLNITIPHKVTVMNYLVAVDEVAKRVGAVNTLVPHKEGYVGYNTDVYGFTYPLRNCTLKNAAVVLGAGGAARAVVYGLYLLGIKKIYLMVRSVAKGEKLALDFPEIDFKVSLLEDLPKIDYKDVSLVVNSTPLGMTGQYLNEAISLPYEKMGKTIIIYDLVYTPEKTKLLKEAEAAGHKVINGELMLAAQGAKALSLWTKKDVMVEEMLTFLRTALKNKK